VYGSEKDRKEGSFVPLPPHVTPRDSQLSYESLRCPRPLVQCGFDRSNDVDVSVGDASTMDAPLMKRNTSATELKAKVLQSKLKLAIV